MPIHMLGKHKPPRIYLVQLPALQVSFHAQVSAPSVCFIRYTSMYARMHILNMHLLLHESWH